jgi:hypothetical protein
MVFSPSHSNFVIGPFQVRYLNKQTNKQTVNKRTINQSLKQTKLLKIKQNQLKIKEIHLSLKILLTTGIEPVTSGLLDQHSTD